MNKRKAIIIGYILFIAVAFVISTIASVLLMTSMSNDKLSYELMAGMAIILQVATSLFIAKGIMDKRLPTIMRIILLFIGVFLFIVNVIGNVGMIQNNSNKTRNTEIKQSVEYQQAIEKKNLAQAKLKAKQEEIKNTTATYDETIAQTKDTLNKSNAAWERNKHTTLLNEKTTEKTETLKRLNAELNAIVIPEINTESIALESENGYTSTFQFLAKTRIIKWIFNDIQADVLQGYFFIMVSCVFEFIQAISFYLLSVFLGTNISFKKSTTPDPSPKQKIPTPTPSDIKPKLNLIKSGTSLGLKARGNLNLKNLPKGLKNSDIQKYIDFMNRTAENIDGKLISRGRTYISENIGIKDSEGRKIVGWLENEGIIKVEGGRTVIVKNNMKGVG